MKGWKKYWIEAVDFKHPHIDKRILKYGEMYQSLLGRGKKENGVKINYLYRHRRLGFQVLRQEKTEIEYLRRCRKYLDEIYHNRKDMQDVVLRCIISVNGLIGKVK